VSFFQRYVEYNFTADLETQLDDVSGGRIDWKTVLRDFWRAFSHAIEETRDLTIGQVIDTLDEELGRHFFPSPGDGSDPRRCPACGNGRLSLKLGRYGAFIGCVNYPECRYTRRLVVESGENGAAEADTGPRELGTDPATGQAVSLRKGPYGTYVQLGEANGEGTKPKRVSLPRGMAPAEVDLARALALLALPRMVGVHPDTREEITAGIGRYGPYLKHGTAYKSLGADDDVLTIGINRAVDLLADVKGRRSQPGRTVGDHPGDAKPITLHSGRYGPYLRHGKTLASLPKSANADALTLEEAVSILAAQVEKAKAKRGAGGKRAAGNKTEKVAQPTEKKAKPKVAGKAKKAKPGRSRKTRATPR
jgi:DNA topoisomerase-1